MEIKPIDKKDHIPVLDGFRGIAVLLVFVSHIFYESFSNVPVLNAVLYNSGFYGVSLFFVLSGFLVSAPFIKNLLGQAPEVSLKKFYTNRLLRILPLFYISSAFFFMVHICSEQQAHIYIRAIPYYLLVLQNISETVNVVNPPTWSISVEFHFYLLLGLCFTLAKNNTLKKTMLFLLIVLILTTAYKVIAYFLIQQGWSYRNLVYANSFSNLDFFIAGILLCIFYYRSKQFSNIVAVRFFLVVSLALLAILTYYLYRQYTLNLYTSDLIGVAASPMLTAMAWAGIIYYHLQLDSLGTRIISSRVLGFYGKISYSLYLLHLPLYTLFYRPYMANHITSHKILISISYFIFISFVSFLSYKFIESPFLKFKNRNYTKTA